jgi:hypothetical protein
MTMIKKAYLSLKALACGTLCSKGNLTGLRHDWPECCQECCHDSDQIRRAIISMRDECWRTGG